MLRPDAALMGRAGERIEYAAAHQHLVRAWWLIRHGHNREAREDLRRAGSAPLSYRLLAQLPAWRPTSAAAAMTMAAFARLGELLGQSGLD